MAGDADISGVVAGWQIPVAAQVDFQGLPPGAAEHIAATEGRVGLNHRACSGRYHRIHCDGMFIGIGVVTDIDVVEVDPRASLGRCAVRGQVGIDGEGGGWPQAGHGCDDFQGAVVQTCIEVNAVRYFLTGCVDQFGVAIDEGTRWVDGLIFLLHHDHIAGIGWRDIGHDADRPGAVGVAEVDVWAGGVGVYFLDWGQTPST